MRWLTLFAFLSFCTLRDATCQQARDGLTTLIGVFENVDGELVVAQYNAWRERSEALPSPVGMPYARNQSRGGDVNSGATTKWSANVTALLRAGDALARNVFALHPLGFYFYAQVN